MYWEMVRLCNTGIVTNLILFFFFFFSFRSFSSLTNIKKRMFESRIIFNAMVWWLLLFETREHFVLLLSFIFILFVACMHFFPLSFILYSIWWFSMISQRVLWCIWYRSMFECGLNLTIFYNPTRIYLNCVKKKTLIVFISHIPMVVVVIVVITVTVAVAFVIVFFLFTFCLFFLFSPFLLLLRACTLFSLTITFHFDCIFSAFSASLPISYPMNMILVTVLRHDSTK